MTDELLKMAISGDIPAFETLIADCRTKAYNQAYLMMGSPEDAADMAQEAFIKAFLSIKKFRAKSEFSTWIYRIVSNTCLDELRRRKSAKLAPLEDSAHLPSDEKTSPEAEFERIEERDRIVHALQTLSPEHRQIVVLKDVQGHSYDEIKLITGLNSGTIKSRLNRARTALRVILEP